MNYNIQKAIDRSITARTYNSTLIAHHPRPCVTSVRVRATSGAPSLRRESREARPNRQKDTTPEIQASLTGLRWAPCADPAQAMASQPHPQQQQQRAAARAAASAGKLATWTAVPQSRVLLLVGVGLGLCAVPVAMHSRQPQGIENPYAASKRRQREERFAWYESDEMPSK